MVKIIIILKMNYYLNYYFWTTYVSLSIIHIDSAICGPTQNIGV